MSFGEKIGVFFKKYYVLILALLMVACLVIGVFYVYGGDEEDGDGTDKPVTDQSQEEEIRYYVIDIADVSKYVTVGKYEGVEISETVADEEFIEEHRKKVLDKVKEYVDADRPAQNGDTVVIDYEGFNKESGEKFAGGYDTDSSFVLGSGSFIPGFEEGIVGHRAGEKFDVFVTFPQNYVNEELRGVAARFSITLKKVSLVVYPEITDELAKKLNFDSAEKLNEAIKKSAENEANTKNLDAAWKAAVANCTLKEYPKELYDQSVKDFVEYYMAYYKNSAAQYGVELEELTGKTEKELFAELTEKGKENADGYLKEELFMFAIAKDMGKDAISAEEYDKALQDFAKSQGVTTDELLEEFTVEQIKTNVLWDRVMTHVLDKAVFVEKPEESAESSEEASENSEESAESSEEASAE